MTLNQLKIGQSARITAVGGEGALRLRLLDMGLIPRTIVTLRKIAPLGDPIEIMIRGYELTLRIEDATRIEVEPVEICDADTPVKPKQTKEFRTPARETEAHSSHRRASLSDSGSKMTFALAGNQNCGKTTLFNVLTGSNQHVGNFPGVTVDQKVGEIRGLKNVSIVDLPGIYSLRTYTQEEIVTRDFLLNERPDGIINIIDATNIERNLYLTLQLIELNIPMVLALNMMDEVRSSGGSIDIQALSEFLGIPVIPIAAAKNEGVSELIYQAVDTARGKIKPKKWDFCAQDSPVHRCIHAVVHLIDDHADRMGIPARFAASKLIENSADMEAHLALDQNECELLEHCLVQMEDEIGLDRNAALASMRYDFIESAVKDTVIKPRESREHMRSVAIDKVLTGKFTAIPVFLAVMFLTFWLTFSVIGRALSDLMNLGIGALTGVVDRALTAYGINEVVHSLIIDGIFAGVGSVLSFLPIIVVLFFFLSILEDTGYMARVAFVMDKALRKIGLSGRSFVPMLIGFGCSVPAIMATRTVSSDRDRKMTILLTPYMSCSAKIPIYAVFASAFFPDHAALVMIGLYITGIVLAILLALILKSTVFHGKPVPFVMELPNYRIPSPKSVLLLLWDKAKDFLERAFGIIFICTIIIWFLGKFDMKLNVASSSSDSLLAMIGSLLTPILRPLGFGDWRAATALISGFSAKEAVVSTLAVLTNTTAVNLQTVLASLFTPVSAASFLIFTLLYTPCVAAISAVRHELNSRWAALGVVLLQCSVAWICSFLVYQIGNRNLTGTAVVLLLLAVAVALSVHRIRTRRLTGCTGDCGSCQGCSAGSDRSADAGTEN